MTSRHWLAAALALAVAAAGCDEAVEPDPMAAVAGSYRAMTWTIESQVQTIDLLAAGAELTLTLEVDGTVAGRFHIPAGVAPEPEAQDVDLAGTWVLEDGIVRFDQPGDTFVRFVDWIVRPGSLRSEFTNGGFTVTTVLRR